jgi:hypothetical protein
VTDVERKLEIARNEVRFRDVNEGIAAGRDPSDRTTVVGFVCECGQPDCSRLVELTSAEYEAVRRYARRFLVLAGHDYPDVESIVDDHGSWCVVEKLPETAHVAEETDPRA